MEKLLEMADKIQNLLLLMLEELALVVKRLILLSEKLTLLV